MTIYKKAIQAIKAYPCSFLCHPDFKAALQFMKDHNNEDRPTMTEGHPVTAYDRK